MAEILKNKFALTFDTDCPNCDSTISLGTEDSYWHMDAEEDYNNYMEFTCPACEHEFHLMVQGTDCKQMNKDKHTPQDIFLNACKKYHKLKRA